MNDIFESQQSKLLSIKQEISLLQHQVNYLLRNGRAIGLLDLDVLMNRTHTIYDQLCSIHLDDSSTEDDFDFDPEALADFLGGTASEEEPNPEEAVEPEPESEPDEAAEVVETPVAEVQDEAPAKVEEEPVEPQEDAVNQVVEEVESEEPKAEGTPIGDEFGFFFRFEEVPETQEETTPETYETVERDGKVIHVMEAVPEEEIPERDLVGGDELVIDNPLEMPKMENEGFENHDVVAEPEPEPGPEPETAPEPETTPEPEPVPEPEVPAEGLSGYFDNDDTEFELTSPETLGERMMHDDHSLAAKLQQNPVRDLRLAIGVNDKFLFVNELFGGSMEKYNKSIENLNDLKTLNGAMIYLNELKIELQWNSSNEAYQKLSELVRRKFESV